MKLKTLLFMLFSLISCIPILITTIFTGNSLINLNQEKLNSAYFYSLNQQSTILSLKFNTVETCAKSMFTDPQLNEILANHDFSNATPEAALINAKISKIISRYFHQENLISDILIFFPDSSYYSYNNNTIDDPVKFIINNGQAKSPGSMLLSGIRHNVFNDNNDFFVISSLLDISGYNDNSLKKIAYVYFLLDNASLQPTEEIQESNYISTYVYNHQGNLFFAKNSNEKKYNNIWDFPTAINIKVSEKEKGTFVEYIDDEKKFFLFLHDRQNNYYLIKVISYEYYNTANIIIIKNLFFLAIICITLSVLVSFLLSKWINKPLSMLIYSIEKTHLNSPVYIKNFSRLYPYEYTHIHSIFNKMLEKMNILYNKQMLSEKKLGEEKLNALKYQINPHFINNTLSSIRIKLLETENYNVAEMISVLAKLIHSSLNHPTMIRLDTEIEDIYHYIYLMQIRHNNNIHIEISIPENLYEQQLQSMLLQPIVENSIRHGLGEKLANGSDAATIRISAEKTDDFFIIEIYDNGVGFDDSKNPLSNLNNAPKAHGYHIGLYNINQRIKLLHGEKYGIDIESQKNHYSIVRLKLPDINSD